MISYVTDLVPSDLWVADYKCFELIFIGIVFVRRFMRSESSKYNWRSSSGDYADLTGKNGLFVGDQHKSEHRYSTLAKAAMDKRFVSFFEMKRFLLFIGNLAASIVENVSTQAERSSRSAKRVPGGVNCSGQTWHF